MAQNDRIRRVNRMACCPTPHQRSNAGCGPGAGRTHLDGSSGPTQGPFDRTTPPNRSNGYQKALWWLSKGLSVHQTPENRVPLGRPRSPPSALADRLRSTQRLVLTAMCLVFPSFFQRAYQRLNPIQCTTISSTGSRSERLGHHHGERRRSIELIATELIDTGRRASPAARVSVHLPLLLGPPYIRKRPAQACLLLTHPIESDDRDVVGGAWSVVLLSEAARTRGQ